MRMIVAVCLLVLASLSGVRAQAVSYPALSDPVPGTQAVAYADLVRMLVPDLAAAGDGAHAGSELVPLRHISAALEGIEPPARIVLHRVAAVPMLSGGRERLALLADLGTASDSAEGVAVLALYDVSGSPALLDAANVAFDRYTSPREPALLRVGEGDDLLVYSSGHHNSSQSYVTTGLVLARDDRLELVDSVFTFDDGTCAYERTQRLDISAGDERPYASISATVREETAPSGAECGAATVPGPPSRSIAVTWRWDTAQSRYLPDSDAFERLASENETRF